MSDATVTPSWERRAPHFYEPTDWLDALARIREGLAEWADASVGAADGDSPGTGHRLRRATPEYAAVFQAYNALRDATAAGDPIFVDRLQDLTDTARRAAGDPGDRFYDDAFRLWTDDVIDVARRRLHLTLAGRSGVDAEALRRVNKAAGPLPDLPLPTTSGVTPRPFAGTLSPDRVRETIPSPSVPHAGTTPEPSSRAPHPRQEEPRRAFVTAQEPEAADTPITPPQESEEGVAEPSAATFAGPEEWTRERAALDDALERWRRSPTTRLLARRSGRGVPETGGTEWLIDRAEAATRSEAAAGDPLVMIQAYESLARAIETTTRHVGDRMYGGRVPDDCDTGLPTLARRAHSLAARVAVTVGLRNPTPETLTAEPLSSVGVAPEPVTSDALETALSGPGTQDSDPDVAQAASAQRSTVEPASVDVALDESVPNTASALDPTPEPPVRQEERLSEAPTTTAPARQAATAPAPTAFADPHEWREHLSALYRDIARWEQGPVGRALRAEYEEAPERANEWDLVHRAYGRIQRGEANDPRMLERYRDLALVLWRANRNLSRRPQEWARKHTLLADLADLAGRAETGFHRLRVTLDPASPTAIDPTRLSLAPVSAEPARSRDSVDAPRPQAPPTAFTKPQDAPVPAPTSPRPDPPTAESATATPAEHPAPPTSATAVSPAAEARVFGSAAGATRSTDEVTVEYRTRADGVNRRIGPRFDGVRSAATTWRNLRNLPRITGRNAEQRARYVRDLTVRLEDVTGARLPGADGQVLAGPTYRRLATQQLQVAVAADTLAGRALDKAEAQALRALSGRSRDLARDLRSISRHFERQERASRRDMFRLAVVVAYETAAFLAVRRSGQWLRAQEGPPGQRRAIAARMREEYRDARPVLRAVWREWWMAQATPEELAKAWQAGTEWAAHGDRYAAGTMEHLRREIAARHGITVPEQGVEAVDLVAVPTTPEPGAEDPDSPTAWYRYTLTDTDNPDAEPVTGHVVAPRWQTPEMVAATALWTVETAARHPEKLRMELTHSDADGSPGAVAAAMTGDATSYDVYQDASLGDDAWWDEEVTKKRAAILRESLTPDRWATMSPAEAAALWDAVNDWPRSQTRTEVIELLGSGIESTFGAAPTDDAFRDEVARGAHTGGVPGERLPRNPLTPRTASGQPLPRDAITALEAGIRTTWREATGRDLDSDQEALLSRLLDRTPSSETTLRPPHRQSSTPVPTRSIPPSGREPETPAPPHDL